MATTLLDDRIAAQCGSCTECGQACEVCAQRCIGADDDDDVMRACAEACRRAAEQCREMAA